MSKSYYYYIVRNGSYEIATPDSFFRHIECYKHICPVDRFYTTSEGWVKMVMYYSDFDYIGFRKEVFHA